MSVSDYLYTFISMYAYLRMQLSLASNKKSDSGVEESALQLFIAIGKCDYKKIEELVKAGRKKGLLNAKRVQGNTFIHQVASLILQRRFFFRNEDIPDVDDSAPLIQDVVFYISAHLCAMILNNYLFPCFCRFSMI